LREEINYAVAYEDEIAQSELSFAMREDEITLMKSDW
jgi:hypothetical protein